MTQSFIACSVTRDDLVEYGILSQEVAESLSDSEMEEIARKVGEYFDDSFAEALKSAVVG